MANWCNNSITFASKNKEKIITLFAQMKEWFNTSNKLNKGESPSLKYFFETYSPTHKTYDVYRAFLEYVSDTVEKYSEGWYFEIEVESAWDHQHNCYVEFLKDYDPDNEIEIYHCADEPGSEVFLNTDIEGKFYSDRYYVYEPYGEDRKKWTKEQLAYIDANIYMSEESDVYWLAEKLFNGSNEFGNSFQTYTIEELLEYFEKQGIKICKYSIGDD